MAPTTPEGRFKAYMHNRRRRGLTDLAVKLQTPRLSNEAMVGMHLSWDCNSVGEMRRDLNAVVAEVIKEMGELGRGARR